MFSSALTLPCYGYPPIQPGQPVLETKIRKPSEAAAPPAERQFSLPPAAALSPAPKPRSPRPLKLAVAAALIAMGLYAIFAEQGFVASDNAVVSAYVVSLRAPIDGTLSGMANPVGTPVDTGNVLARLDNPRVDDAPLRDMQAGLARLIAERTANLALRDRLIETRQTLARRTEAHKRATAARLQANAAEAEQTLAALSTQRDQLARDLARRSTLIASGFVAAAEIERLTADLAAAERGIAAQAQRLAANRVEAGAAQAGILSEPGANDVAYSAQRMDEVDLRLAELDRTLAITAAEADATDRRLHAADRRDMLMRGAVLTAPAAGMVWKQRAANGERLAAGDVASELVDCTSAFLLVAIPQDRFSDIALGMTARYRLSGERAERTGRVLSVSGQASLAADRNLAAAPIGEIGNTVTVRVAIDPSANNVRDCLIGRTARVLLPASGGSLPVRLFRRFF